MPWSPHPGGWGGGSLGQKVVGWTPSSSFVWCCRCICSTHLLPYNKRQQSHQGSKTCVHTKDLFLCQMAFIGQTFSTKELLIVCAHVRAQSLSCVWLSCVWPHGLAHQTPLKWDFPGKNTGVCCHALLQGIFLSQGPNSHLLHWQAGSLSLSHLLSVCSKTHLKRFSFKMWWGLAYTAGVNKLRWNLMHETP